MLRQRAINFEFGENENDDYIGDQVIGKCYSSKLPRKLTGNSGCRADFLVVKGDG